MKRILDPINFGMRHQSKIRCKLDNLYLNFRLWVGSKILRRLGYCWADIVMWAYGYIEPDDISKRGNQIGCTYCDPECKP